MARLDQMNMNSGGNCYREVVGWTLRILCEAHREKHIDSVVYNLMVSEVFQLRGCISVLYNYDDQPIPFVYVHLVYYLSFLYLLLTAFFVATNFSEEDFWANVVALLIVSLNNLFTIGMLEIGRFMSDPFGADLCDLSIIHFIEFTLVNSRRILTGKAFALTSYETERMLESERPHKGDGFTHGELDYKLLQQYHHAAPLQEENIEDEMECGGGGAQNHDEQDGKMMMKMAQQREPELAKATMIMVDSKDEVQPFHL